MSLKAVLNRFARSGLPPVVLFAIVVAIWQGAVSAWDIKPFLLPGPGRVWSSAVSNLGKLVQASIFTGTAALCGFAVSLLAGTLIGFVFSQSRILRSSCYPYAIFLQTVPIIAIAPLVIRWFGTGFQSVVAVAFIISLFPIIANATAGLLAIDPDLLDLFRLNNARRGQVLWKLRLPNSVPAIITGAKTSSGLAVVGAIVGEFFAGYGSERFGLGYLILTTTDQLRTDELFAAVIASTLLGILIFGGISLAGAWILSRWYDAPLDHRG